MAFGLACSVSAVHPTEQQNMKRKILILWNSTLASQIYKSSAPNDILLTCSLLWDTTLISFLKTPKG